MIFSGNNMIGRSFDESASKRASLVLTTQNKRAHRRDTLEVALELGTSRHEPIVLDGASSDGTLDLVAEFGELVGTGSLKAANSGFLLAHRRQLQQIADDDQLSEALERAIALREAQPEIDLTQCDGTRMWEGVETPVCVPPGTECGGQAYDVVKYGRCRARSISRRGLLASVGLCRPDAAPAHTELVARAISAGATLRCARLKPFWHPIVQHYRTVEPRLHALGRDVRRLVRTFGLREYRVRHQLGRFARVLPRLRVARRWRWGDLDLRSKGPLFFARGILERGAKLTGVMGALWPLIGTDQQHIVGG